MDNGGHATDHRFFLLEPYLSGTVYVSKSGNDSNTGSAASPVLTIARANAIAASTRITRIVVGAGTYAEEVAPPRAGLIYQALGSVTISGGGVRDGFDVNVANVTVRSFNFTGCVQSVWFRANGDGGRAENCNSTLSTGRGFYAQGAADVRFVDCRSYAPGSGYGYEFEAGADNGGVIRCWSEGGQYGFISKTSTNVRFDGCVALDSTTAGFYSKGANGMKVYNSVGYNVVNGVFISDDTAPAYSSNVDIKNSIFVGLDRGIYATATDDAIGLSSNYNDLFDCDTEGQIASTSYNTLAAWQGAGYDANSLSVDPAFASVVYGGFVLPAGSALLTAGEGGVAMGREGSTWNG